MNEVLIGIQIIQALATPSPGVTTPEIDVSKLNDTQFSTYIEIRKTKEQALYRLSDTLIKWSERIEANQPPPPVFHEVKLEYKPLLFDLD